ncbi:hypothetical protein [Streptomyces sp. NBC_01538]|uniref:hypothetical protein n=1 Tax=Streptomyces sp. NBC_01538 TaxID=2903897 RepID=UPI003869CE03
MAKSDELPCLRLRVELAAEALSTSDEPSGSVLVGEDGAVPAEGRVGRAHALVRTLPVNEVAPGVSVEGPVPELAEQVRDLHRRFDTKVPQQR